MQMTVAGRKTARLSGLYGVGLLAGVAVLAACPANAAPLTADDLLQAMRSSLAPNSAAPTPARMADLGPLPPTQRLTIALYLRPSDPAGLTAFATALQTPGGPSFHRFLTAAEFLDRFAPTTATVATVEATLQAAGFSVTGGFSNRMAMRFTGTVADIDATFGLTLHGFSNGVRSGIASLTQPVFPAGIAGLVRGIGGFETIIPSSPGPQPVPVASGNPTALSDIVLAAPVATASGVTDVPGRLTPGDYEKLYDMSPLVAAGATGQGRTIAIVTEQNLDPSDPAAFWIARGIAVAPNHLQLVPVDGIVPDPAGACAQSVGACSESDLDVEQAGAIAPDATVLAYLSPSGPSGLLDGYEAVASQNRADVVSSSFGTPEQYFQRNGTELYNATLLPAFNDVFLELAVQGQTVFAATGDAGAFDINRNESGFYPVYPVAGGPAAYTPVYSVNAIAANPLVTAAGGTTLPISAMDDAVTPSFAVSVAAEQPWSTSLFPIQAYGKNRDLAQAVGLFEAGFPDGGGGGASDYWPVPDYQKGLAGVVRTPPFQALIQLGGTPALLATEPALFAGRNIPDLSANADPHTGYLVVANGLTYRGFGGTSFVAPQFAGTLALIDQALGHRIGQLNPLLYRLQRSGTAPVRDIVGGDNWGYAAHVGYDPASGLGAMDAARLYAGLKSFD